MKTPFGSRMGRHPHQIAVIGLVWYRKEDYDAARAIMADADLLPLTYDKWRYGAAKTEAKLSAQGHKVIRAIIDPTEFPLWCRARGLNVDAKGRNAFANDKAAHSVGQA